MAIQNVQNLSVLAFGEAAAPAPAAPPAACHSCSHRAQQIAAGAPASLFQAQDVLNQLEAMLPQLQVAAQLEATLPQLRPILH